MSEKDYLRCKRKCHECGTLIKRRASAIRCHSCIGRGISRPGAGPRPTAKSTNPAEYRSWLAMMQRCYLANSSRYRNYGAKGIKVCERWRTSFEAFLADMGPRPVGTSLDRFPNQKGDYEPGNCRWATAKQQNRNSSNNRLLDFRGESKPLAEWAEHFKISRFTVRNRLADGWTIEEALTTPVAARKVQ